MSSLTRPLPVHAPGNVPFSRFSTHGLPPEDAFAIWHESVSVMFQASRADEEALPFAAEVGVFHLGDLLFSRTAFGAQRFLRTPRMLRRDGLDHFLIQLYRSGGYRGEADGHPVALAAGEISIIDLARPLDTQASVSDTVSLVAPRHLLDALLPNENLHGLVLRGTAAAIYADHLLSLQRRLPTLPRGDAPIVVRAMAELLATLVRSGGRSDDTRSSQQELALTRAKRYIEHQLHRSRLTPDEIRAAAEVSRASLYRLFEASGGVAHYMLSRRLERCCQALENPRDRRLISEIAYAHGFASESHFSRAFRQRYGRTPGEVRAGGNASVKRLAVPRPVAKDTAFDDWIRDFQRGATV